MSRTGVCAPAGFRAAGVAAGIKAGELDVAAIVSDRPAAAAGVFTTNIARSAPVLVSIDHLTRPCARAVVVSSGNANAATGEEGRDTARAMCSAVAGVVDCDATDVLVAQTGLIGVPLDRAVAVAGAAMAATHADAEGGADAAAAILTTDTVAKISVATAHVGGATVTVGGIAKGAAMLAPSMATMIAVLTTDAAVAAEPLRAALALAVDSSFHTVVVDGCRSTSDTVFLLANGASATQTIASVTHHDFRPFAEAVEAVCVDLALQMARDAEGSTKFLTVEVAGARDTDDARAAAKAVAGSLLVKCSLAGDDPYWGRVLADLGASGAEFDPEAVSITYGGVPVCRGGVAAAHDAAAVAAHMAGRDIVIRADLGAGGAAAVAYGSDLTHAYVDENTGTS